MRPLGWGLTAALVATMASNVFYLTMTFYYFFVIALLAIAAPAVFARRLDAAVKVVVLTTSYPRDADDVAGPFVRDGVEHLRAAGRRGRGRLAGAFRHFGIAYGDGIVNNLRAAPWKALALPLFLLSFARAARRAARGADVVHAHWLPSWFPALATGKPLVLQLWGSDVELATRAAAPRAVARPARAGRRLCVDGARGRRTRARGARRARDPERRRGLPDAVREPDEPPHVLYVGRLSEEKGVRELAEAADGLPLVVVGDGPLRDAAPAGGRLRSPGRGRPLLRAGGVVVVPSRREGYGVVAREAMAHGRPVVATAVGGLLDAIEDGVTGLLVPPRRRGRAAGGARAAARRRRAARARSGRRRASASSGRRRRRRSGGAAPRGVSGRELSRPCSAGASVSTRSPSTAVSFLPSSRDRAAYEIGTS